MFGLILITFLSAVWAIKGDRSLMWSSILVHPDATLSWTCTKVWNCVPCFKLYLIAWTLQENVWSSESPPTNALLSSMHLVQLEKKHHAWLSLLGWVLSLSTNILWPSSLLSNTYQGCEGANNVTSDQWHKYPSKWHGGKDRLNVSWYAWSYDYQILYWDSSEFFHLWFTFGVTMSGNWGSLQNNTSQCETWDLKLYANI